MQNLNARECVYFERKLKLTFKRKRAKLGLAKNSFAVYFIRVFHLLWNMKAVDILKKSRDCPLAKHISRE